MKVGVDVAVEVGVRSGGLGVNVGEGVGVLVGDGVGATAWARKGPAKQKINTVTQRQFATDAHG